MITYTCKGRRISVGDERERLRARIRHYEHLASQAGEKHRTALDKKAANLHGQLASLDGLDDAKEFARAGCGCDLTEIIQGIPEDGETYEPECPDCGLAFTVVRTPPDADE
ncbi:MAG TPA: hypothetical protein ENK26_03425 [Gammaproteobacteria bacterium]|nr:hypothetical protein [Gammaproteobacteria bacterium]